MTILAPSIRKSAAILAGIVGPVALMTIYLEISRRRGSDYALDVPVLVIAALIGGGLVATVPKSPWLRIALGVAGALTLFAGLFVYALDYVCFAFGVCL